MQLEPQFCPEAMLAYQQGQWHSLVVDDIDNPYLILEVGEYGIACFGLN